jgi:photosystem II stability/assembly factor-like uncharacterized protein
VSSLPQPQSYFAAVTDPVDPLTLYAEGSESLAKTTDGGATWQKIFTGVTALGVAPGAPRTLYVASAGNVVDNSTAISRSDDGGSTWRTLPASALPAGTEDIYELAVDPLDPGSVYLLGFAFHLDVTPVTLHSTDGGQSWSSFENAPFYIHSLAFDRRVPGTILALSGEGLERSRDGGTTWVLLSAGLPPEAPLGALLNDRSSGTFYLSLETLSGIGQVVRSTDDGTTWTPVGAARPGYLSPLALDGASPGRLYAGASDVGLLVLEAGAWKVASSALVPPSVSDIEPDPLTPGTFYALHVSRGSNTSRPDLSRSQDGGVTWQSWVPQDASGAPVYLSGLVFDPFVAGSIYSSSGPDLYHSADGGRTWSIPGSYPAGFSGASSVVADPLHAGVLLAAGFWATGLSGSAILRSTDRGQTWTSVLNLPASAEYVDVLVVDASAAPETFFAGGSAGFWRSQDGGQTWTGISVGPANPSENSPESFQFVTRLEVDSSHTIYAELFPPSLRSLAKSTDGGITWATIDTGLPAGTAVRDLLVQGTTLDISTSTGVYVSEDGGGHWTAANDGLPSTSVSRLAAGASGSGVLLAATDSGLAISPPLATSCKASDTVLCLENGRFALQIHWTLQDGTAGDAHPSPLTDESGGFWFFSPESVELVVKAIDGGAVNGRFWIFGGALTNVAYTLTVTEVATGSVRAYTNPQGHLASFADTNAFASTGGQSPEVLEPPASAASAASAAFPQAGVATSPLCTPAADTLCLAGSRFAVRVSWQLPNATGMKATAVPLSQNTGAFWFFGAGNLELLVKILDGRAVNGHFWIFFAGLSGVDYTATVIDTVTGTTKSYRHPAGALASSADTAF